MPLRLWPEVCLGLLGPQAGGRGVSVWKECSRNVRWPRAASPEFHSCPGPLPETFLPSRSWHAGL